MMSYQETMDCITVSDSIKINETGAVITIDDNKKITIQWEDYTPNQLEMIKKWIELTNSYDGEYNSIDRMIRVI